MHIEWIEVANYRNLTQAALELSPETVLFRGDNAQGKTNLLEALYVCATGKSFRGSPPAELLQHGTDHGFVKARLIRHGVRHLVEVRLANGRRTLRVDDRGLRSAAKLLEMINVVSFFPDDLRIIKGSPEERRRFVDRAVANHRPDFVEATLAYQKALKSRNALLRAEQSPKPDLVAVYDTQLLRYGTLMHQARVETLEALVPRAVEHFGALMSEVLNVSMKLGDGCGDVDEGLSFEDRFRTALKQAYPRDRRRGLTTVGPHRADLEVALDDKVARSFASQGQQRALVLSLKMAEVDYLTQRLGTAPILLLDDVSSELDRRRTDQLFELVRRLGAQVLISSTGAVPLPLGDNAKIFDVAAGSVSPGSIVKSEVKSEVE